MIRVRALFVQGWRLAVAFLFCFAVGVWVVATGSQHGVPALASYCFLIPLDFLIVKAVFVLARLIFPRAWL